MTRRTIARDEHGVALVLTIAFMVVIGALTTALLSSVTTALDGRSALDGVRDRQYAADAAIEQSIARVRGIGGLGPAKAPCGGPDTAAQFDGYIIHVDCANQWRITTQAFEQRNVLFTACLDTVAHSSCTDATTIIRAQVNYEAAESVNPTITKTYVQSWSVNG